MNVNCVICGDAAEVMRTFPDGAVDAILTDPPYGVCLDDATDYVAVNWLGEAYRVLKDNAALMMCVGQATLREFWNEAERVGFRWLNTLVWWHPNSLSRQSKRFAIMYDPILYFVKGDFVHNMDAVRVPYRSTERLKYPVNNKKKEGWRPNPKGARCGDVWNFPAITTSAPNGQDCPLGHKWQKPTALFDRMIKATCSQDSVMLDPFCGSGTSLIAALQNKVLYIGIDNDPHCVEMSSRRVKEYKSSDLFA